MGSEHNADYGAIARERKKITESARKLAEKKRTQSPYSAERQNEFIQRLNDYIEEQKEKNKPLTIAGFILASQIPKRTWYDMKQGDYDAGIEEYRMLKGIPEDAEEYITEDGEVLSLLPWSEVIDRCYLLAQQQREEACIEGKAGNVVGNIFLLKAQHGLSDMPDQIKTQTNIQLVASAETAMKALEMLK